jgi:hypothetical protein
MFKNTKALMSLFVILLLTVFYIQPSYAQQKPSQKTIKGIILKGYSKSIDSFTKQNPNIKVSNLKFDSFKITKGVISKKPAAKGESAAYNIEVSYKISYLENQDLAKWKAEQIRECEYNIFQGQNALKKAKKDKDAQKIKYNKDKIIVNKQNIKTIKKYPDSKKEKKTIIKKKDRMAFIKKGGKWYGYLGWK